EPGDLFTADGVRPTLAFHEKEISQSSQPGWVVQVVAGDVDLLRRERVHLVARGDRDAGDAVQKVAGQVLERLALCGVSERLVDDGKVSLDDRPIICGHRLEPVKGGIPKFADVFGQAAVAK